MTFTQGYIDMRFEKILFFSESQQIITFEHQKLLFLNKIMYFYGKFVYNFLVEFFSSASLCAVHFSDFHWLAIGARRLVCGF